MRICSASRASKASMPSCSRPPGSTPSPSWRNACLRTWHPSSPKSTTRRSWSVSFRPKPRSPVGSPRPRPCPGWSITNCRYVIEEAWPDQRRGTIPEGGTDRVSAFQRKLMTFDPTTKGQEILHAARLQEFNGFVELRRQRLLDVTTGLPSALWYVVAVGAVLGIVLTWLFSLDRLSVHLAVAGILSLLTGLVVFLIAAMDHPYRGEVSVSPEAFEIVQRSLMAPREKIQ